MKSLFNHKTLQGIEGDAASFRHHQPGAGVQRHARLRAYPRGGVYE